MEDVLADWGWISDLSLSAECERVFWSLFNWLAQNKLYVSIWKASWNRFNTADGRVIHSECFTYQGYYDLTKFWSIFTPLTLAGEIFFNHFTPASLDSDRLNVNLLSTVVVSLVISHFSQPFELIFMLMLQCVSVCYTWLLNLAAFRRLNDELWPILLLFWAWSSSRLLFQHLYNTWFSTAFHLAS